MASGMGSNAAVVEGLSGAAGAVIALITTYPLITVTTNQAVGSRGRTSATRDIFRICKNQGPAALFRGIQPAVIGTVTSQGIYFYLYAALRRLFTEDQPGVQNRNQQISIGASLLVASLAGSCNVLLTNPIWLVVTRMQTAKGANRDKNFIQVFKDLYWEDGLCALWRGVVPSLIMVSNPTVQYVLYELLVARWLKRRGAANPGVLHKLTDIEVFIFSAIAKLGATVSTYPLLLVKNRIQSDSKGIVTGRHATTLETVRAIWRGDGIWGFYKGMRTKILQSILAAALMFMVKERVYETTSNALHSLSAARQPAGLMAAMEIAK